MNIFKRKARRTTVVISDQTRTSHASLSSSENNRSSSPFGSKSSVKPTPDTGLSAVEDYHGSSTVRFDDGHIEDCAYKNLRKKVKHAHFIDDTIDNSAHPPVEEFEYQNATEISELRQRDMTLLGPGAPNIGDMAPDINSGVAPDISGKPMMSLYAAIIKGEKSELKKLISGSQDLLDIPDNFGRTPLMYCLLADRLDCAKFLIKMGCKLDQVDNAGRTAVHLAAHKGSYKFLELLHHRGARIDMKDHDGQTALHLSTRNKNAKCLDFLLRNVGLGMVDTQDNQMRTALHWSAAFNNTDCVKLLIKHGINIGIPDSEGKTPLHWALNNNDPSAVNTMSALLEKSPGVLNWQDYDGRTALHYAVAGGNATAVEMLVNFKASADPSDPDRCDLNRPDNTFRTPLHWAAQLGHTHIVKLLLKNSVTEENKRKTQVSDLNGATPFLYAALNNNSSVVEAMIAHDPTVVEQADIEGRNALMWAAGKGANDVILVLLGIRSQNDETQTNSNNNNNANTETATANQYMTTAVEVQQKFVPLDVNKADNKENTALHVAAMNGQGSSVELLLRHGARHDLQNYINHTPIFGACEKGHLNVVKYLLDYNASITLVDSECRSPLHWAALEGHAEVCELLIKEGLDVDIRDTLDRTPLHCAAFKGFINCMNLLLESRANVDLQDQEGRSALHWAAQSGHLDATKLLFQYAVFPNPMEYTEERLTPLDHALQKEREEVAQYLIEQGALSAENIRNIAATKIQAFFRGFQVRKTFLARKKLLMKMLTLRKESKKDKTRGKKRADGKSNEDGQQAKDTDSIPLTGRSTDVLSSCAEDEENKESISVQGDNLTKFSDVCAQQEINKVMEKDPTETQQSTSDSQHNEISIVAGNKMPEESGEYPPAETRTVVIPNVGSAQDKDLPKKTYKKRVRERRLMQAAGSDSDSSKSFPTRSKVSSSSSPMSLRSAASIVRENENGRKFVPTPPSGNATKHRRSRKASPRLDIVSLETTISSYPSNVPALDNIGNEDNIQSEKVSAIAYRSPPCNPSFFKRNYSIPHAPVVAVSSSLELSEYIESLMRLMPEERKILRQHQQSRKEAFVLANQAATVIQKGWWRHIHLKNPVMYKKFQTLRRRAKKTENRKKKVSAIATKLPRGDLAESKSVVNSTTDTSEIKTRQKNSNRKKKSNEHLEARPLDTTQLSAASSSDILSNTESEKSTRTKKQKTVTGPSPNSLYISVEKLEAISRIYGNPQLLSDLTDEKTTTLPYLDESSQRGVIKLQPVKIRDGNKSRDAGKNGDAASLPITSQLSPRQWTTSVSKKNKLNANGNIPSRTQQKIIRSGPPHAYVPDRPQRQSVDISRLPLQWQKLYGELQSRAGVDSRQKNSARFSYNLQDFQ